MSMDYTVVRQSRKSISIRVLDDGRVEVRAPLRCPEQDISRFVQAQSDWIARRRQELSQCRERAQRPPEFVRVQGESYPVSPSPDGRVRIDLREKRAYLPQSATAEQQRAAIAGCYRTLAQNVLPDRVQQIAQRLGLTYGRVRINSAHGRWGSCSSQGNLNFSLYLMMASPKAVDAVVIHELLHRVQLNHSPEFRRLERQHTPDYEACRRELDELALWMRREGWV